MSYEAMRWAMSQPVTKSSAKFVLVAMADCVNAEEGSMVCWPSVLHLSRMTGQDRKTVMDGMKRLRDGGFIEDSKERRGATGQVVVYRLKSPEPGTVKPVIDKAPPVQSIAAKSTESGTDTKTGTVPDFPSNGPVFPHEQYQIPASTVPKAGHGTSKEPRKNQEGTKKAASGIESIPGVPDDVMSDWLAVRKAKRAGPVTASVIAGMTREAAKVGMSLPDAVRKCAECSWQGFQARYMQNDRSGAGGLNAQEALEASNRAVAARFLENDHASH